MNFIKTIKLFQLLSLDVVIGAFSVGAFAAKLLGVNVQPAWWFVLPAAVWTIYTSDHLADGFSKKNNAAIDRHLFHFRHRRLLSMIVLITGVAAIIVSWIYLDRQIILGGIVLSVLVLLYFFGLFFLKKIKKNSFLKEFQIAFIYTAGIWLAPLLWYGKVPSVTTLIVVVFIFLLVLAETVMNSYFDFENDQADGHSSITTTFGKRKTEKFIFFNLFMVFLSTLFLYFFQTEHLFATAFLLVLTMAFLLLSIMIFKPVFQKNNLYRWFGEIIFWIPALLMLA